MMRVYKVNLEWDKFDSLAFVTSSDRSFFDRISREKLQSAMRKNRVLKMTYQSSIPNIERKSLPPGDFSYCQLLPVFSPHAIEKMSEFLISEGNLYPIIDVKGVRHSIFIPQTIRDGINLEESRVEYFHTGEVLFIEKYAFNLQNISSAKIFMTPERELVEIYCTEVFVNQVSSSYLSGLEFKEIYST